MSNAGGRDALVNRKTLWSRPPPYKAKEIPMNRSKDGFDPLPVILLIVLNLLNLLWLV